MLLNVEQVTKSKSGKALRVKANGAWYGARLNSGLDLLVGKAIEAEVSHSDQYGDTIEKYRQTANGSNGNGSDAAQRSSPPPSSLGAAAAAPAWLPFASNTVAHAIAAGIITAPNQIEAWVQAAHDAYNHVNGRI